MSHNLILLIGLLSCIEANLAVDHPEVRAEILRKRIVPVFEPFTSPPRTVIAWIPSFLLRKGIVELILGSESTVELIFKCIHKLAIPLALKVVVLQLVIIDVAVLPVVMI